MTKKNLTWKSNTGDPRISWFQNSWSSLFHDSVLGTNFVNFPPFHDFQKKLYYTFFVVASFSQSEYWDFLDRNHNMISIVNFFHYFYTTKKLHSLIRQSSATLIYCFKLLNFDNDTNYNLFFLFLHKKKGFQYLQPT